MEAVGALIPGEYVGTIHGLMYEALFENHQFKKWVRRNHIPADLIIIDEASMVSEAIWKDLKQYRVPIIAIGDHGQLPPIGGNFSLMEKPDYTLTEIQRQAAGNPIIAASVLARTTGIIPLGRIENELGCVDRVTIKADNLIRVFTTPETLRETMVICGYNRTRIALNQLIRNKLGFYDKNPMAGERVICLRNNQSAGLFNGMGGVLDAIDWSKEKSHWADATITMDDESVYEGSVIKEQFGAESTLRELKGVNFMQLRDLFDWGYALTAHKAQGSEAANVILVEERFSKSTDDDWKRWLYTSCTRSKKNLTIITNRL
jgi:exodeoxyribonuclease-5